MTQSREQRAAEFYARTYDATVRDWPGEIEFYRQLAAQAYEAGQDVLEVACGTGRVAIRLARLEGRAGGSVTGLDLAPAMLAIARRRSAGMQNLRWVQADMRDFALGERFGLAIVPGHAFQNLVTAEDQVACLQSMRRHLLPGGRLAVHLDHPELDWLGSLAGDTGGGFEPAGEFRHPGTGHRIRTSQAWSYEPAAQAAVLHTRWEELDAAGRVTDRWEKGPVRLHVVFPFEMEHLLARTGYRVEALYGDFHRNAFTTGSRDMIWLATHPGSEG